MIGFNDMSMFDEIDRRIKELRRKSYKWVKGTPVHRYEMCAVIDNRNGVSNVNRLSEGTMRAFNEWICRYTNQRWYNVIDWNDSGVGAQSVDDVIAMFEKFRAEL